MDANFTSNSYNLDFKYYHASINFGQKSDYYNLAHSNIPWQSVLFQGTNISNREIAFTHAHDKRCAVS